MEILFGYQIPTFYCRLRHTRHFYSRQSECISIHLVCACFFSFRVCVFLVFLLKPKHRSHITDAREFLEFRLCVFFSCCCSDYFRFHFGAIVRGFVLSVVHLFTRIQNTNNKKKTMRKIEKKSTNSSIYASNNERRE